MPVAELRVINFAPNPIQKGFIESQAEADLFSSRVGEGKSTALAWSILYHTRHNPGAEWAFIRDTYENIQKTSMKTFFEWFPPGIAGNYNQSKKEFTWDESFAKGTVTFVGMDDPGDASKLLSWVLGGIAIDEPAPAAGSAGVDEMVFDLGMQRLRQPGMKWRPFKMATNNPDEEHWTYRRMVGPQAEENNYRLWQPSKPENIANLPEGYYEKIRRANAHRPDLIRRFVDGEFGFQQEGAPVTPQWSDRIHLSLGLTSIRGREIAMLWDFGHNPTCIITQRSPLGYWNILNSFVGEGIGVEELIVDQVIPVLRDRFSKSPVRHIGDPAGNSREQTSIKRTAVKSIKHMIGGTWRSGPVRWEERKNPLQAVLTKTINGTGLVQVDRLNAPHVWHALRGGWHYHKARSGLIGMEPQKDKHSHPGDAMSYGAAILFPAGKFFTAPPHDTPTTGHYFTENWKPERGVWRPEIEEFRIGPKGPSRMPEDGEELQLPGGTPKGYF
jgi:hypothetical protein